MIGRKVIGVWCALAVCAGNAGAQAPLAVSVPTVVSQGLTYLSWTISGDEDFKIAQLHAPLMLRAPLRQNIGLTVYSGASHSSANWDVDGDNLGGLLDSRVEVEGSFADGRILLAGGVSLPTGKTQLARAEQQLVGWLASDIFNFPLKLPGEGFGMFGELGVAAPAGPWAVGSSIGLLINGEYNPYETPLDYKPGSRWVFTVGADRRWRNGGSMSADVILVGFTDDQADGEAIFREGSQIDLRWHGQGVRGRMMYEGGLRYIVRGEDRRLDPDQSELVKETHNTNGSEFRFLLSPHMMITPAVSAWIALEGKFVGANDYASSDPLYQDAARLIGFGGGADFKVHDNATLGGGVRVWSGSADGSASYDRLDLSGFEIVERLTIQL